MSMEGLHEKKQSGETLRMTTNVRDAAAHHANEHHNDVACQTDARNTVHHGEKESQQNSSSYSWSVADSYQNGDAASEPQADEARRRSMTSASSNETSADEEFDAVPKISKSRKRRESSLFSRMFSAARIQRAFSMEGASKGEYDNIEHEDDDEDCNNQNHVKMHNRNRSCFMGLWYLAFAVMAVFTTYSLVIKGRNYYKKTSTGGTKGTECGSEQANVLMEVKQKASIENLSHAAVASDHPLCSEIGTSIMRDMDGNAVDAAIATALCLGVANPSSSGIGGGGFILIHADDAHHQARTSAPDYVSPVHVDARSAMDNPDGNGKMTEVIDCREVAPSAASTEMFEGLPDSASVIGGLAVGVPGELRGLELAHARHGKLPWASVVEPAMKLARDGVAVSTYLSNVIQELAPKYEERGDMESLKSLITKNGNWKNFLTEGDIMKNPKLGETLQAVMDRGADALYVGDRASRIAKEVQKAGGILTEDDLAQYKPRLRSPLVAHDVNGFSIVGVPPPSSGGATLIGAARFLSRYKIPMASYAETLSVHRMVEACRHVFAIRMSLSDPAFNSESVADAVNDLVSGPYMESLRSITKDNYTLPLSLYGGEKWAQLNDTDGQNNSTDAKEGDRRNRRLGKEARTHRNLARRFGYLEDHGTSHFSVVDKDGNAVAMTTTVNTYFGSGVLSESSGVVLNNQMDDFSNPGRSNFFGLKPSEANFIKPGKIPLSSMSPTMVFRDEGVGGNTLGDIVLVIGASGGPKIITAVLQTFINFILLGKPLFDSVISPRVHEQLIYHNAAVAGTEKSYEDKLTIEVPDLTKSALSSRGHKLLDVDYTGVVQAVAVDPETKEIAAMSDPRKLGTPAGY